MPAAGKTLHRLLSVRFLAHLLGRGASGSVARAMPSVSVPDMKRLLRLGGCAPEDGYACLISACPICKATKRKDIGSLYVNKTTGFYCCSGCKQQGQWEALERLFSGGAQRSPRHLTTFDSLSEEMRQPYTPWIEAEKDSQSLTDSPADEVLRRFNLPVFPEASKVLQGVRVCGDSLLFPLKDLSGEVSGIRFLSHSHPDEPCVERSQGEGLLQLGVGTGGRGIATLVPSAGDAIALLAARVTGSAVCLPDRFSRLPQELLPQLEKFSRLTLWGSPDCMEDARSMTRKLGEKRCLLVRSTEGPLAALRLGEDLRVLAATARPVWHKAITSFSALRVDVLADLRNIDKVQGVKWKRFPALTRLLHGHRRGELTVLTGPTGCGKTTFCSEYSLDLALQGVNTLWGSFEIRNSRLARTMLQQLAGIPLDDNIHLFDKFADDFEKLPIHFLAFHGQQSIKDVMEVVEHAFYVHDIAHVIVDNVQFMLGMGDELSRSMDRYWRQDAVIAAFRGFATRSNCHVTLVMHPRKERDVEELSTSSIFGSAKASQEADSVLIIQDKRLTSVRGKKYLQVAKNRYSGDLGIVPLDFDKAGLSYAQKKKQPKEVEDNRESPNEDSQSTANVTST